MLATIIANQNSQIEKMDGFMDEQKSLRTDVEGLKKFKFYLMGAVGVFTVLVKAGWEMFIGGHGNK